MSHKNLNAKIKIPKKLKEILNKKKISQIYKRFEKNLNIDQNFAVAVSGGPDSLALSFLSKIYSVKKGLDAKFFIVDHKIRAESSREAKLVKKLLTKIGIKAQILIWKGKKTSGNLQSKARKKRYDLLFDSCYRNNIYTILLGHQREDLFENFFIRILRGSGLKGLISLDTETKVNKMNLLRPLLFESKDDLILISKKAFNFYIKDPLNEDVKYQRIRIRKLIVELKKNGLDKKKFFNTIKNLKYSDRVIKYYVSKNLKENTFFSASKNQYLVNKEFFHQPYEVIFRSFSIIIQNIGKKYYPVRGKKLDNLINDIQNNMRLKVTLGGCIVKKYNDTVIIYKEI